MRTDMTLCEEYQGLTVFQMLEKMAGKFQEREVFAYWREERAVSVSYVEFFRDVRRLAAYFDRLGLRGRRIVIDGRNTYEQITAMFAAMAMGAVAAPLCFDLELEDLRQLISRLEPGLIVCDEEDEEILPDIQTGVPVMACMGESGVRGVLDGDGLLYEDDGRTTPEMPALILATSGSESRPKLVVHTHRSVMPYEYRPAWRTIFVCPMYHIIVHWMIVDIASGAPSCLSDFRRAAFDIRWYRPEAMLTVPAFADLLIRRDAKGALDLGGFREITTVGAKQLPGTGEYLNARGIFYGSTYGITEAGGKITCAAPEGFRAGSDGQVGPWNQVRVTGQGEILVRGSNVMLEYLDDPEATARVLEDGWYHTGDVGYLDEDEFLFITGRIKNIIILPNGENVSPEAVEYKLYACGEIEEAAVLEEDGRIAAHIWCGDGGDRDRARAFIAEYNKKVPPFQAIRKIVFRERPFPKTASGKIKRRPTDELCRGLSEPL